MKGKTKIILTNVETGEQEVHEDNNLITNALDKLINIELAMNYAPNSHLLPFATNALGGLMLFDGELTEDPDNIHFPSEAHLVGYADRTVNTTDKYRGSFNSIESGKLENGYASVWDFGTGQANGTIKAVALTHVHAGACPIYNYNGPDLPSTNNGAPTTDLDWYPVRYDGEYVYVLKGNSTTHTMRLARVKIPMLRMGVADYSNVARTFEVIASWDTEVTTYTWYYSQREMEEQRNPYTQTVYADDTFCYEDGHDGFLYCMFYSPRRTYNTYQYDITYFTINYGDGSFEKSETIRLNTGTDYWTDKYTNEFWMAYRYRGHVHKGILYRMSNSRKIIYKIPLNNPAAYSAIRIFADSDGDYVGTLEYITSHEGCIYFEAYHYTSTSYEIRNGILYPDGIFLLLEYSYSGQYWDHNSNDRYRCCRNSDDDLTVWGRYDGERFTRSWAANYLGTINNLSSPITKTAAQTMKIVYTLTDVDEEEPENGG